MTTPIDQHEGRKYLRTIQSCVTGQKIQVDVYDVLRAFDVKDQPAGIEASHAIKKLLCPGQRGKGDYQADLVGAIAAINRALDSLKQAEEAKEQRPGKPVEDVTVALDKHKTLTFAEYEDFLDKHKAMTFAEYEDFTDETAIYPREYAIAYCLISLIGEIPEIIDSISSFNGNPDDEQTRIFCNSLRLVYDQAKVLQSYSKKIRDNKEVLSEETKKILRSANISTNSSVYDELGDALYYLCQLARSTGISLRSVAIRNKKKLLDRKARGVIGGSGDKR